MSSSFLHAIIAFAISLPPVWYPVNSGPETPDEREARVGMAARVAAQQAHSGSTGLDPTQLAAITIAIWFNESRFDWHVHAGEKSPIGTQDQGRARCLGQVQTWPKNTLLTDEEWKQLAGTDESATARCAAATQAYLWEHAKRCLRRGTAASVRWDKPLSDWEVALLFAAYGAGKCVPIGESTRARVATYRRGMAAIGGAQ